MYMFDFHYHDVSIIFIISIYRKNPKNKALVTRTLLQTYKPDSVESAEQTSSIIYLRVASN